MTSGSLHDSLESEINKSEFKCKIEHTERKMIKKILKIAGIILLIVIAAIILFIVVSAKVADYRNAHYYENATPAGEIEKKYTEMGPLEVSAFEKEAEGEDFKKYEVWYPAEMKDNGKQYPLVIMVNGTGVKASAYKEVFRHLASWGFIVAGNEDEFSWSGASSAKTLDFMLQENEAEGSVFYQHIDTGNIGIAGHSQGGVGTINAVTDQYNGDLYKAMWTASATHIDLANGLGWPYDVSKVTIPYMMVAGTGIADGGDGVEGSSSVGIAPLFSLQANFDAVSDEVPKVMAREKDKDHGDMLRYADGYMTAWFMYWLQGDEDAGKAFFGENAEILLNPNWQDVQVSE